MAVSIDAIDWVKWMRLFGKSTPELDDPAYDAEWVADMCATAAELAQSQCPECVPRLRTGELSERMFAYVVCQAVLRTVRQPLFKSENNSAYSYTRFDSSPDLWFTDKEKQVLTGLDEGPFGSVPMGVDRIYGR